MKRRLFYITIVTLAIFLTSCSYSNDINGDSQQDNSQNEDAVMDSGPVKGGSINLFCTAPDTLNPLLTNKATIQNITRLIYEGLVKLDSNGRPTPSLSDKWSVSTDGLIWTFHIRENVYWQDKIPMNAEDVEFTLKTLMNPAINSVYKANIQNIATFAAVDRNTVRVFLKKPSSFTPEMMTFPIIPKHYFNGEDMAKSPKNMKPVGTGPFTFIRMENRNITLSANELWWNADSEKNYGIKLPYLSEINIKILDNASDAVSLFQTGDLDMTPIPTGDSNKYSGRADLAIKKYTGRDFEFLAFNMNKTIFKDKSVRQAIACAIDRDTIVNNFVSGDATVSDLPVYPGIWLNGSGSASFDFDVIKARDILAKGGWKAGNSGVMYKIINGVWSQLSFNLAVNESNVSRTAIAEKIVEQLSLIGIKANIVKLDPNNAMNAVRSRRFDMAFIGVSTSSIPDLSFMYSSTEIATGNNVSGYSNPTVDGYLEQLNNAPDENSKKEIFKKLKNIIEDEVPYVGLYFYDNAAIYKKNVRGELMPTSWNIYNDISKWYIAKIKK